MTNAPVPAFELQDEFRRYAEIIVDAPAEWTPHFTRSELLPLARAYLENERLREALERIDSEATDIYGTANQIARRALDR